MKWFLASAHVSEPLERGKAEPMLGKVFSVETTFDKAGLMLAKRRLDAGETSQ